jgi:hypothetical protein
MSARFSCFQLLVVFVSFLFFVSSSSSFFFFCPFLGFGLGEIPKGIWKNADWTTRQKVLTQKVAKMAVKLDDAHQEFSNAIVVSITSFVKVKALFGRLI